MREIRADRAGRRRFLKAFMAAGSGLPVAANQAAIKSIADAPARELAVTDDCVVLEAPSSRNASPIEVKPLEFSPDHPLPGLPGTDPFTWTGDLSARMMDGAHSYTERKIGESVQARQKHWARDLSSPSAYE